MREAVAKEVKKLRGFDDTTDIKNDGAFIGADGRAYPGSTPLSKVPAVLPSNGKPVQGAVIFINGIMVDSALHLKTMQALANTGVAVVGLHNSTKGMLLDLVQCLGDKLDLRMAKNAAVTTAANVICDAVKAKQPIRLAGHSQGALVLSRAIDEVTKRLILEDGLEPAAARQRLSSVSIETYGGASASFPDGPSYTHYVNRNDVIPLLAGIGIAEGTRWGHLGRGAQVKVFSDLGSASDLPALSDGLANLIARFTDREVHGAHDIYFKHR